MQASAVTTPLKQKMNISQVFTIAAGHFMIDFYVNILVGITPILALQLDLSSAKLGIMATATGILSSVLQPYFGYVVDRHRWNWLLPFSVLWAAIGTCLIGMYANFYLIIILTVLGGLGSSVYHPMGAQFIATISPGRKGAAQSIYNLGGNIGLALCPLVSVAMVKYWGMESLLYLIIPAVIFVVVAYQQKIYQIQPVLVTSPKTSASEIDAEEEKKNLRKVILLNVVTCSRVWAHTIIIVFIPTLYVLSGHSEMAAGQLLTTYFSAGVVGAFISGYLVDYMSGRKLILYTSICAILFMIGFFNTEGVLSRIMLAGSGFMIQSSVPVSVVIAQKLLHRNAAMASGLMMGFTFGVGGIGALLIGVLGDFIGLSLAVKSLLVLLAISTYFAWRIPEESR